MCRSNLKYRYVLLKHSLIRHILFPMKLLPLNARWSHWWQVRNLAYKIWRSFLHSDIANCRLYCCCYYYYYHYYYYYYHHQQQQQQQNHQHHHHHYYHHHHQYHYHYYNHYFYCYIIIIVIIIIIMIIIIIVIYYHYHYCYHCYYHWKHLAFATLSNRAELDKRLSVVLFGWVV